METIASGKVMHNIYQKEIKKEQLQSTECLSPYRAHKRKFSDQYVLEVFRNFYTQLELDIVSLAVKYSGIMPEYNQTNGEIILPQILVGPIKIS